MDRVKKFLRSKVKLPVVGPVPVVALIAVIIVLIVVIAAVAAPSAAAAAPSAAAAAPSGPGPAAPAAPSGPGPAAPATDNVLDGTLQARFARGAKVTSYTIGPGHPYEGETSYFGLSQAEDKTVITGNVSVLGQGSATYPGWTGMNLNQLSNVRLIKGDLFIAHNPNLTDITGLRNLKTIGGTLTIMNNDNLTTLDGLQNLTAALSPVIIKDNISLQDLQGLRGLTISSDIRVTGNGASAVVPSNIQNLMLPAAQIYNVGRPLPVKTIDPTITSWKEYLAYSRRVLHWDGCETAKTSPCRSPPS